MGTLVPGTFESALLGGWGTSLGPWKEDLCRTIVGIRPVGTLHLGDLHAGWSHDSQEVEGTGQVLKATVVIPPIATNTPDYSFFARISEFGTERVWRDLLKYFCFGKFFERAGKTVETLVVLPCRQSNDPTSSVGRVRQRKH